MASAAATIDRRERAIASVSQDRKSRPPVKTTKLGEVDRPSPALSAPTAEPAPYPTVLIATASPEVRQWLSSSLKSDGYLLLEAQNGTEVLHFAKFHSRPIQVLLAHANLVDGILAHLLARLRPDMRVVILEGEDGQPGLPVARALDNVRRLLPPIQPMPKTR